MSFPSGRRARWIGVAAAVLQLHVAPPAAAQQPALEHFTVVADNHPLAVWARRPAAPKGTILLVHGRTWSSLPDFDLQVPGESRSVLAALAARGYAAYAIDLRGYGSTPRDASGWDTPRRAAADVAATLAWIAAKQPLPTRPALLGWSNGSRVAQLVAQLHPELISSLILYGYPADPADRVPAGGDPPRPPRERTTPDDAASDFISPDVTSKRMESEYIIAALRSDPVRADWRNLEQWNDLDPSRIRTRTLLLQGERDPLPRPALVRLYSRINVEKRWVTLMGGDHAALLEDTKPTFIDAVAAFLRP